MTVGEMLEYLKTLPPEMEVVTYPPLGDSQNEAVPVGAALIAKTQTWDSSDMVLQTRLIWLPLLSATVPIDKQTGDFNWLTIPFPVYASPKIDGFRAMVQRSTLVSRNGLAVRNKELQARYGRPEYEGLDGELTDGPPNGADVFNRTSRVVTKADADAAAVRFNVIDYVPSKNAVPFSVGQRISVLKANYGVRGSITASMPPIPQTLIKNIEALKAYEAKMLAQGYEGVMLRRADQGAYPRKTSKSGKPLKENRSTLTEFYLARLKRFEYGDAVIVSVSPLEHNVNEDRTATGARSSKKAGQVVDAAGRVGSAMLRDWNTGKTFSTTIASEALRTWQGWADERRWKGVKVRYKYQLIGSVNAPRINTCSFAELLP